MTFAPDFDSGSEQGGPRRSPSSSQEPEFERYIDFDAPDFGESDGDGAEGVRAKLRRKVEKIKFVRLTELPANVSEDDNDDEQLTN